MSDECNEDTEISVQYDNLSNIDVSSLEDGTAFNVFFNINDANSLMTTLVYDALTSSFIRFEKYASIKEMITLSAKELLVLYIKRTVIASDTSYFHPDDPKLHSFLSKLSYPAVVEVAKNIVEFGTQFKTGKISMKLPSIKKY